MKNIILLNKKEGETPLEALKRFCVRVPAYKDVPMTYAGRLDPMASGVLLVLAGDEAKKKEKYLKLDKEYKFQVLFGFATDTYDILGKVRARKFMYRKDGKELKKEIKENLKHFTGLFMQEYPMYSSRTVNGRPLFSYARGGEAVESPAQKVSVKSLALGSMKKIASRALLRIISNRVKKVKGDFRQDEILKVWQKELSLPKEEFFIADFKIACGGGTYVRAIANSLGERLGIPALAFSIERTKLGKWGKRSIM